MSTIRDRERGYKDALLENEVDLCKKNVSEIPFDDIYNKVGQELKRLLTKKNPITAIYAINNSIAKACLEHLVKMNLSIPTDVAILSYEDIDVFKFCNPPVSAVAQPINEIGDQAVDLLLDMIKTGGKTELTIKQIVLPAKIIIRKSCGKV